MIVGSDAISDQGEYCWNVGWGLVNFLGRNSANYCKIVMTAPALR